MIQCQENDKSPTARIMGEINGCVQCVAFVVENLPDAQFDDVCKDATKNEKVSRHLMAGVNVATNSMKKDELSRRPDVSSLVIAEIRNDLYVKMQALTKADIMREFNRSPKQLTLKRHKIPAEPKGRYVYPVRAHN